MTASSDLVERLLDGDPDAVRDIGDLAGRAKRIIDVLLDHARSENVRILALEADKAELVDELKKYNDAVGPLTPRPMHDEHWRNLQRAFERTRATLAKHEGDK